MLGTIIGIGAIAVPKTGKSLPVALTFVQKSKPETVKIMNSALIMSSPILHFPLRQTEQLSCSHWTDEETEAQEHTQHKAESRLALSTSLIALGEPSEIARQVLHRLLPQSRIYPSDDTICSVCRICHGNCHVIP